MAQVLVAFLNASFMSRYSFNACLNEPCWYLQQLIFCVTETICGKHEKKLLRHLMADYDNMERPVEDESEPLMLTFGVTLQQIIDVVKKLR